MNHERFKKVCDILEAAWNLEPPDRDAYLIKACGGDTELLEEVRSLVAHEPTRSSFLEPPDPSATRARPMPVLTNPTRIDDFELKQLIGRGGFGVVYRARQVSLDREVAVKVLPDLLAPTDAARDRFVREARAIARLRHPAIVTIHSVGESDGLHWFAMDLVDGHDLHTELEIHRGLRGSAEDAKDPATLSRAPLLGGPTADGWPAACARLLADVADGLHHAHVNGVVHRDVKPRNLLLDSDEKLRIVDFGLAKDERFGSITASHEIAGTPHYMSPEQTRAKRLAVDHRTDIYSLGVVLYEMLTLARPYEGNTAREILDRIQDAALIPPRRINPRVPRDLDAICQKAMAHAPDSRYETALKFGQDLRRFLAHEAVEAQPPTIPERFAAWLLRRKLVLAVVLAFVLVAWTADRVRANLDERERVTAAFSALVERSRSIRADTGDSNLLRAWRAEIAALRDRAEDLSDEQKAFVAAEESRAADLARGFQRTIATSGAPVSVVESEDLRWERMLDTVFAAECGAALDPENGEFLRLRTPNAFYPRLTVRPGARFNMEGRAGRVFRRSVDPKTGEIGPKELLGEFPLADREIQPGFQRIVVEFGPEHFGEYLRDLRWGQGPIVIDVGRMRASADLLRKTARFEETQVTKDIESAIYFPPDGRRHRIEAFRIELTEVTIGEFLEFVADTGRAIPPLLQKWPERDSFRDCPVVGITWSDAVEYAEWANMRLPTAIEWSYAARGPSWRLFPWKDPIADPRAAALVGGSPHTDYSSDQDVFRPYVANIRPVGSFPAGATPEGVLDLFGSVWELTESSVVERDGDDLHWSRNFRYAMGSAFDADPVADDLRMFRRVENLATSAANHVGFRCAKSVAP